MTAGEEDRRVVETPASPRRPLRLHPFRAIRLAPDRVADPATLRHLNGPYPEAGRRLAAMEAEGQLRRDEHAALLLHEYTADGYTVRGLVAALDLSERASTVEDRAVLPHEAIHADQARALAERMARLGLNPAPILLVHRGTPQARELLDEVQRRTPEHDFTDRAGQRHRQWRIHDEQEVRAVQESLADQTLVIADGHHRYAAYLQLQEQHPGTGWDRGLVMVVDQGANPLFLGAVHRVVEQVTMERIVDTARGLGWRTQPSTRAQALDALGGQAWLVTDGQQWVSVRPGQLTSPVEAVEAFEQVLPHLEAGPVLYRHTLDDALGALRPGRVAVVLPAPDFTLLHETTATGTLLPEKATSFQPKPSLGIVMRDVASDD